MSIYFTCSNCGRPFDLSEDKVGQTFTCDVCSAQVTVPLNSLPRPTPQGEVNPRQLRKVLTFATIAVTLALSAGTIGQVWNLYWDDPVAQQQEQAKRAAEAAERQAEYDKRNAIAARLPQIAYPDLPAPGEFAAKPPLEIPTSWVQSKTGEGPGSRMQLRIYLPPGEHAEKSLPCIVMPPLAANVLAGVSVTPSETYPEALPYVEAGYAVIVYSIDGQIPEKAFEMSDRDFKHNLDRARRRMKDACFGVANGRNAVEYAIRNLPQVDPQRIYAAGSDFAGTISLLLAENEPRLAGCVALAPCIDTKRRTDETTDMFIFHESEQTPSSHPEGIKCPVFLYYPQEEESLDFDDVQDFAQTLTEHDVDVKFVADNAEDVTLEGGVAQSIQWLGERAGSAQAEPETTPPSGDE
ncbi:dienelactone hydrolase family protein [Blastopirellula sp. JC732]|uniref:Dienelactone hydrolase family protein n=1 Tax=Blastopirellula sediminis TaxID=2894196 RepID=A0A9X1MSJ9_9BACT|nr:dienelactone hydrolase family protein [Blastopirellula sediminis]MCC9605857.1 dienelactone hydrolase family protein [Blastopirellula sediminis]MCC9630844.1 dienelactone hydrolase family protein [Blastopirellula sediminis]